MSELWLASFYSFKVTVCLLPFPQCPPRAVFLLAIFCVSCRFSQSLPSAKEVSLEQGRLLISETLSEERAEFYSCRLLTLLTIEKLTFFPLRWGDGCFFKLGNEQAVHF